MDPITLTIELIGVLILVMFVVLPVREFKQIFAGIRKRDAADRHDASEPGPRA